LYSGDRYKYAKEIGYQWFNMIDKLSKAKLSELKKQLDGYSIIGEYCGNPNHQHLIKYK
jgi:hypothetical protein